MTLVGIILFWVLRVAMWVLVARAVISWVPLIFPTYRPRGVVAGVFKAISAVTDPPMHWMQRFIRPIRLGATSLDLSLMVWFVVLLLAQRIVVWVFV